MVTVNFPWTHSYTTRNIAVVALSDRLNWAEKQGDRPLWPTGPTASQYVKGFIRQPGMGSYVTQGGNIMEEMAQLADFFWTLKWEEVTPPEGTAQPGYKYYQAELSEDSDYEARKEIVLLGELDDEKLEYVRVRKGPHGLELYTRGTAGRKTKVISIIVDSDGLVTWHPGEVAPKIDLAKATVKM